MKKLVFVFVVFSFLFSCKTQTTNNDKKITAKVVFLQGNAYFSSDGNKWDKISVNQLLEAPGVIKTDKKTTLRIKIWEDTTFTLYSESLVNLTELTGSSFNLNMKKGSIINSVESLKGKTYTCKTPAITAGVRGTVFKIETDGKKDVLIVQEGTVWTRRNIENAPEVVVTKNKKIVVYVDDNEKLKNKVKDLKKEDAEKILDIETEDVGEDVIKEEIEKQDKYIEEETKKQEEFIEKKSKDIEELKEKKSADIEKSVEKKSKDIEEMMNKDMDSMDELLKKAKEKKVKK